MRFGGYKSFEARMCNSYALGPCGGAAEAKHDLQNMPCCDLRSTKQAGCCLLSRLAGHWIN